MQEALRFLLYGGLVHAPLVHHWVATVARWFPPVNAKQIAKVVRRAHL